ncbi:MAG TPA: hypothetical protein VKA10_01670, partial [Prolixibacteraceae bacterium]|nr:hypothetical protein [Prolixibacteraceae bacterium]
VKETNSFQWQFYLDKPGSKTIDISYSFKGTDENRNTAQITVEAAGTTLVHNATPTGKTIGEPNRDWVIDNFPSRNVGKLQFPKPGFYTINVNIEPAGNEEIKFQWLWIE